MIDLNKNWHNITAEQVVRELKSQATGLSSEEANQRLLQFGTNELATAKETPIILVFLRQFLSPLIYVLFAAGIISILSQIITGEEHFVDAFVIFGVIILNASIGTFQEVQAEKAMKALKEMAAPKAKVLRNDKLEVIAAKNIVPGDIVILESGDKVPADIRLIESSNLKVNESTLTGESMPVEKILTPVAEDSVLADQDNMLFMSTIVTNGRAKGIAVATGMSSEMGKIATGIEEVKTEESPLQKNISRLSKYLVFIFLGACILLVVVGILQGLGLLDMLMLAIAAAVASIPEGLPAVVTVVLAIGMRSMARRNAIIRKLVAVETLGSATVICSDKTGTLTLNQMTVRKLFTDGRIVDITGEGYEPKGEFRDKGTSISLTDQDNITLSLRIGTLCNDASLSQNDKKYSIIGDPTEGALVVAGAKAGLSKEVLQKELPRLDEISFESEKQYMATLHSVNGREVVYVKGSPEKLIEFSTKCLKNGQATTLESDDRQRITEAAASMSGEALRVIALAYRELSERPAKLKDEMVTGNLVFVGLAGMADPPRDEAKAAINLCRQAGIKVMMITGDNKITAESIARQLEMPQGKAVTGSELQKMSDEELYSEIDNITVFARIEPLHKLRIVNALKKRGHITAMTGDGVNDAPAIKAADIGISMGITGTDVAKEASDMVLSDDNFASIVTAVEEGRAIFTRLRGVLFYTLNTNLSELVTLILALIFVGQSPLLAVQILWINLVTDTAGDVPLGFEPKFGDELKKPPRHPSIGLIYPGLMIRIIVMAVLIGMGTFLIFRWAEPRMSVEESRSIAFCAMAAFEWFMALSARSDEHSVFEIGFFKNKVLMASMTIAVLLQLAVIYVPFLQIAFQTFPLTIGDWALILIPSIGLFLLEELVRKRFFPNLYSFGKYKPFQK